MFQIAAARDAALQHVQATAAATGRQVTVEDFNVEISETPRVALPNNRILPDLASLVLARTSD